MCAFRPPTLFDSFLNLCFLESIDNGFVGQLLAGIGDDSNRFAQEERLLGDGSETTAYQLPGQVLQVISVNDDTSIIEVQ